VLGPLLPEGFEHRYSPRKTSHKDSAVEYFCKRQNCRSGSADRKSEPYDRVADTVNADNLRRLADLLRRHNSIGDEIAGVIGRPAERGHVGEYIAAHIFGIALEGSARKRARDGRFTAGALAGHTVNVKWYGKQEGVLDLHARGAPDYYLALTGAAGSAASSRGKTRPVGDPVRLPVRRAAPARGPACARRQDPHGFEREEGALDGGGSLPRVPQRGAHPLSGAARPARPVRLIGNIGSDEGEGLLLPCASFKRRLAEDKLPST